MRPSLLFVLLLSACDPSVIIGDPDGGVDAGPTADAGAEASCSMDATEPNDSALRAFPLAFGVPVTSCILGESDADLFSVTAGSTPAGGYFVSTVTTPSQLGPPRVSVQEPDRGDIVWSDGTVPVVFYWASRPGVTWNLRVSRYATDAGSSGLPATVVVTWTPLDDAFEPNDTQQDSKPLSLGTPLQALLVGGRKDSNLAQLEYLTADWYRVQLTAGQRVRMELTNLPLSVTPTVSLYCASCSNPMDQKRQSSPGQDVSLLSTNVVSTSGEYFVRVTNTKQDSDVSLLVRGELPPHFTQPYTLTVTQEP